LYISHILLVTLFLCLLQEQILIPLYKKVKLFITVKYLMFIAFIKRIELMLVSLYKKIELFFMVNHVLLSCSPKHQILFRCIITACFVIWKHFDFEGFLFIGGTAPSRGMPLGEMLNPTGGGGPRIPQGNNTILYQDPNRNDESREHQSSSNIQSNTAEASSSSSVAEGFNSNIAEASNRNDVASSNVASPNVASPDVAEASPSPSSPNVAEASSSNVAEASNVSADDWRSGNPEAMNAKRAIVYDKLNELCTNNKTSDNQGKSMNSKGLTNGLSFSQDDKDFVHRRMVGLGLGDNAYRSLARNGAISGPIDRHVLKLFEARHFR
jgi:hypothetical protein